MNCLLTSASFEERSLALATDLPEASDDDIVILLDFAGYEDVAPYLFNRLEIVRQLAKKKYKTMTVSVRLGAPLDAMRQVESIVEKADDILLDISTLPRNYLFEICSLLAKLETPTRVRYYRPVEYGSELSRGVASIRSIPGFEGMHLPYGHVVLAVILGFEGYKATFAWEAIGPSRVIAFIGDPPY